MPVDFEALFLAHYQSVFRLAYRIAGTREEAEDLAQETFTRLHRAVQTGSLHEKDPERLRGWLFTVVTNLAYNSLRGQGRRQRRESTALGANGEVDSADLAERAEMRLAVRQALRMLPERQVQLLLLRYAGLSYRELAEALNVAPGSVGTLLARAEAAFAKAYQRSSPADYEARSNPVNRGGEGT